jgi:thioredoxin reductase (NADPH)
MNDELITPELDAEELAALEAYGTRRHVEAGEYLYRPGDFGYDFFVVLAGLVDVVLDVDGQEKLIVSHGPGRFLGELNLLSGMRAFVTARVAEPGELLAIPLEALRRIIATQPHLSDRILVTFMARRNELMTVSDAATRVVGSRYSGELIGILEYLSRTRIPHQWLDPEAHPELEHLFTEFGLDRADMPVVFTSGAVLRSATPGTVADYLGLTVGSLPARCFDLVIVGGGPAGLAAAVYGASEGLRTLGLDNVAPGGQAGTTSRIENYFGFPIGLSGGELTQRGIVQAEKFGAQLTAPCAAVALREQAGHLVVELSDGTTVAGRAVIAASGARYRRLEVDRLRELEGRGVYYAATELEAQQCAGSPVVIVGGGNSAGQAAVFMADQGSKVTVVVRGPDLRASMSSYLVDRLDAHPNIETRTGTQVVRLDGDPMLSAVGMRGSEGESTQTCAALFSFIGADPQSGWLSDHAALDSAGFVLTDRALTDDQLGDTWTALGRQPLPFETSHPGLFAVGDLRSGSTKRVAAAVGEGSAAVRSVHDYLAFSTR